MRLPQALLVPEAAIIGLGKDHGTVWTVEDGHLQQRDVTLGHRLLDGRYEITGGVPERRRWSRNCAAACASGGRPLIASEPKR